MTLLDDTQDPVIDPNKDYFAELVGEGRKFKTPQDLGKAKHESDEYIRFLERGRDELRDDYLKLREDYNSRAKLEELIDQLSKQQHVSNTTLNVDETEKPTIDPNQIKSLVSEQYQQMETNKKQEENYNQVRAKLQQRYGNNYKEAVKQQIDELGITESDLNDMARRQPKVLIRTLGLDQPNSTENFQSPPRSQQRSDSFAPSTQKRTWAYYEKMRKEDPVRYLDAKTQVQMHRDRAELEEAFEDGNWKTLN